MVRIKASGPAVVLGVGTLLLSACGGNNGAGTASSGSSSSSGAAVSSASSTDLKTTSSALGTVVVDAQGRTVYAYTKDTQGSGASACSGSCAGLWPAVTVAGAGAKPTVTGVSGTVATITRSDGSKQVTLDGRPLYTFSGDSKAGDATGQGYQSIWWVVAPDGAEITAAPGPSGY